MYIPKFLLYAIFPNQHFENGYVKEGRAGAGVQTRRSSWILSPLEIIKQLATIFLYFSHIYGVEIPILTATKRRRGALFFFQGHLSNFKATRDKNRQFRPELSVSGLLRQFEFTDGFEMMHKS